MDKLRTDNRVLRSVSVFLLIRPSGIFTPYSLSYDNNTKRLWVGSLNNTKVCVYRYEQQDCLNGKRIKIFKIKILTRCPYFTVYPVFF